MRGTRVCYIARCPYAYLLREQPAKAGRFKTERYNSTAVNEKDLSPGSPISYFCSKGVSCTSLCHEVCCSSIQSLQPINSIRIGP